MTGVTFLYYLNNVRLKKAHILLTTTTRSIRDIAADCGFSSTGQMTRLFNQFYGSSPRKFRYANTIHPK